jgi:acyl-homoserine lactone acylase PvdQ
VPRRSSPAAVAAAVAAIALVAAPSTAQATRSRAATSAYAGLPSSPKDYATIALDIVPSGEYGAVPAPANADQQAEMYNALTPLFNHVSESQLTDFFKPMTLGNDTAGPYTTESVPHAGVTIVRDQYDVPHIFGQTRDDLTWAAGWVEAEDQGLLLEEARYDSLLAAIDAPGISAIDLIGDLESFQPSQQTETAVAAQTKALLAAGKEGHEVLHDLDLYLDGINAYLKSSGSSDAPFTLTDIYAFNALKDQFVGEGGGQQAADGEFLSDLEQKLGAKKGYAVWNDLREANDASAQVSVPGHVRFQPPPTSTSGNVMLDPNSLSSGATEDLDELRATKHYASNALLVSGARSATHHPIMVAGPQIGYYYPGLTTEVVEQAPGVDQRGVTSAPFPGYIFIGRSQDSAWSLTSAGLDQITTYVETLCGHSTHKYIYDGRCRAMSFFDAGTLNPGTAKAQKVTFWTTVNGPVIGYARVHGRPVALARKRASYGKDVLDLLFYYKLSHGLVHNVKQFFQAASLTPQTFNSLYIDDKNIAVYSSGLLPIQPSNVDQDLPVNGNGTEEWRGWVPAKDHPQGVNPADGEIVNWNNRTEAGYEAPDDNWMYGPIHRVLLLMNNLGHGRNLQPANLVAAMNEAATQDVREATFEPTLSKLLHTGKAPNARDAEMLALLDQWHRQGSSRLDRTDPDGIGNITAPGAAILDAAWPYLTKAWASTVLGPSLTADLASLVTPFQAPPGGQEEGWYGYMEKDLETILGEKVKAPYAVRYCGGGSLKLCRKLLWGAINQAGNDLQANQGSNPAAWRESATPERITFIPGLLPYSMRYTNRPSGIQQVISFDGHSPGDS